VKPNRITVVAGMFLATLFNAPICEAITTSGPLAGSETWSNTVYLTGDVTVTPTGTLTILPGTRIDADPRADDQIGGIHTSRIELIVDQGTLVAVGTELNPIVFTARVLGTNLPAKGEWYGLRIRSSFATLRHCVVEYAKEGLRLEGGAPAVELCTFDRNEGNGVMLAVSGRLSDCTVTRNGVGIYVSEGQTLTVTNANVRYNSGNGIGGTGNANIRNCTVSNNGDAGIGHEAYYTVTLDITGSTISNNGSDGIAAGTWWADPTATIGVTGSLISLNGGNGIGVWAGRVSVTKVAGRDDLPILSAFSYLESAEAFGCGAGLTHLYIDGSGEVCPCNLVPLSFGNLTQEPFGQILDRMGHHFCRPRTGCVGRLLTRHLATASMPARPDTSEAICQRHLPREHALPAFFRLRDELRGQEVGAPELRAAYNRVHGDYDQFWLSAAAKPVDDLIQKLSWRGNEAVFEAGCGTGYATALLARRSARVVAVDLSEAMLAEAQARIRAQGLENVRFVTGDAVEALGKEGQFDRIFSSWVLGYIPLAAFFDAASRALAKGGQLACIVHRENSPTEPLEIFGELIVEEPAALRRRVAFDFPRDAAQVSTLLSAVGLKTEALWQESNSL
jgi:protein-L-isoaspartate O-methyltransferase